MNLDNLKNLSRDELVKLADTQGVQIHWKAKPETIIKQIIDKVSQPVPVKQDTIDPRLATKKEAVFNTREQVEAMLASIKARSPEFESIYMDNDQTVTFKCKGAEDSHNMSVPLRWLQQKAQIIARGRLAPIGHDTREWGSLSGSTGKNAYTNAILAV